MKKGVLVAIVCFCFAFAFVFVYNSNLRNSNPPQDIEPSLTPVEAIEVKGEIICLPHKNSEGPQTLECAFGIKDSKTGLNYALAYPNNGEPPAQNGEIAVIYGDFTPMTDTIYDIVGKIDVRSKQN